MTVSDQYYLDMCLQVANHSHDPSTKVGAVIVHKHNYCVGYNRLPKGVSNTPERLNDSDFKNRIIVHAEIVALLNSMAAKFPLDESILYVWAKDAKTGQTWGGPPCTRCAVELIHAGIGEIRVPLAKGVPQRWVASLNLARELILEAGVKYTELEL